MAFRLDIGSMQPARRLADGRLVASGRLTRSGVFVYHDSEGNEVREYRPPDEVFADDSLQSFALVPVTDDHPGESLDAANARKFAVGAVGEQVRQDGDFVAATVMVYDASTIEKMEAGKVQLSCGYQADVELVAGTSPSGERYDGIQRNIRGNHVAIVETGRAGPDACVRMDDVKWTITTTTSNTIPWPPTETITITDGADLMTLEEMQKALTEAIRATQQEKARADAAEATITERDETIATVTGERDAALEQVTQLKKDRDDSAAGEPGRIRERVALETAARKVLCADVEKTDRAAKIEEIAGMKDREIKIAVIKKIDNHDISDDQADAYVDAWYDSAIKRAQAADESLASARRTTDGNEPAADAEAKARADMIKRNSAIAETN
jgi:hypothetical protein